MKKIGILGVFILVFLLAATYLFYKQQFFEVRLEGETAITLNYQEEYHEQGAYVYYKNDKLPEAVAIEGTVDTHKLGTYKVNYHYTWMGFDKNVERLVEVDDLTPPRISLIGDERIKVKLNSNFEDPGAKAEDNYDGDISANIVVSSNLNTNSEGIYEIIYQVEDSRHHMAEARRIVEVYREPDKSKNGIIYLTFDDGPNEKNTNHILDILKEENVKATFFVTGRGPDYLIQREYEEGHTVALHTYSHDYKVVYRSVEDYYNDLKAISDRVERITGEKSRFVRFPGGSSNTISKNYCEGIMSFLALDLQKKGYRYYDWNISSGDADGVTSTEAIIDNVISNLSKNRSNVVLFHDTHSYTAEAIQTIIRYAKEQGYRFAAINDETPQVHHNIAN